jgi:putative transposase
MPHHVIQRGNDGQSVFRDDVDRRRYLQILLEVTRAHHLAVHAYVLMDNHVLMLASPSTAEGLSRTMQSIGRRYVGWFNSRHGRSGTLWEGRFRCAVIETDGYLLACMRYVELNPVRAGLVARAGDYAWSSATFHLGQRQDPLVTDHPLFWTLGNTPFERESRYQLMLREPLLRASENSLQRMSSRVLLMRSKIFSRRDPLRHNPMAFRQALMFLR